MLTVVHAADLHIDSPLRGLVRHPDAPVELIRTATRRATEKLVTFTLARQADALVLAGDVYDGEWRGFETGLFFQRQMQQLHEAGVKVFLVNGNHDADSQISRNLTLPPNVHRFTTHAPETAIDERLGLAVHGQGYAQRAVTDNLVAHFPAPVPGLRNIGLLHTALDGRTGHAPYAPCTADQLAGLGYDYWALGHVHTREEVSTDPPIVFCGNIQGRHAQEEGPKGATVITFGDGPAVPAPEVLDVVRWAHLRVDAAGADGLETVLDRVREALHTQRAGAEGRMLAARVSITGRSDAHVELWRAREQLEHEIRACGQVFGDVWIEKVRIATEPAHTDPAATDADERGRIVDELARTARSLGENGERLRTLIEADPLWSKLPPEVRTDTIGAGDEHWRENLLAEASDLLMAMLSEAA